MREVNSYRATRRNAVLRHKPPLTWPGIKPTARVEHPPVRENRSKKWPARRPQ